MTYYLAIDIGASSGRHMLCHREGDRMILREVYRFENRQIRKNGHDCWDMENLWQGVLGGLSKVGRQGIVPASIGIDTWGVDYLLLDENDRPVSDAVAYRDARTNGMDEAVSAVISPEALYARTGIQKQLFNTIYQLTAQKKEKPEELERAAHFLMIPEYLNFLLTGQKVNEYTNATTTGLVNARTGDWDRALLRALSLPERIFHPLSMPGTAVGRLLPSVRAQIGYDTTVVLPATHDTGSAFLAVPARDEHAVYLSSGTWSLLGVETKEPLTDEESRRANFTNEGGAWHRFRYLKNIMGLWMIQSVRRELSGDSYVAGRGIRQETGKKWSFSELEAAARQSGDFESTVDVNRPVFLSPDRMITAVKEECRRTGQRVPESVGAVMQCIYRSLALCYRDAIRDLSRLTGRQYTSVNIVSGGCKDDYLNSLTARATGLPVLAGPVEGTAIGNLAVQMIAAGEFKNLSDAREAIRHSFEIKEVTG